MFKSFWKPKIQRYRDIIVNNNFQLNTKLIPNEIYFIIFSYLKNIRQYRGIDKHTTNVIDGIIQYYENIYNKITYYNDYDELMKKINIEDAKIFYERNYKDEYDKLMKKLCNCETIFFYEYIPEKNNYELLETIDFKENKEYYRLCELMKKPGITAYALRGNKFSLLS